MDKPQHALFVYDSDGGARQAVELVKALLGFFPVTTSFSISSPEPKVWHDTVDAQHTIHINDGETMERSLASIELKTSGPLSTAVAAHASSSDQVIIVDRIPVKARTTSPFTFIHIHKNRTFADWSLIVYVMDSGRVLVWWNNALADILAKSDQEEIVDALRCVNTNVVQCAALPDDFWAAETADVLPLQSSSPFVQGSLDDEMTQAKTRRVQTDNPVKEFLQLKTRLNVLRNSIATSAWVGRLLLADYLEHDGFGENIMTAPVARDGTLTFQWKETPDAKVVTVMFDGGWKIDGLVFNCTFPSRYPRAVSLVSSISAMHGLKSDFDWAIKTKEVVKTTVNLDL